MPVVFKSQDYITGKQILAIPDHYVCVAHTFLNNDTAAITEDGRKVIKAGTIYPKNDATAIGIVFSDMDVTDGDMTGAILVHGFVKTAALPVEPADTAKTALKQVTFLPIE